MDWHVLTQHHLVLALLPDLLREVAEHQQAKKGEILFRLGDRPRYIFYVIAGEVRLIRRTRNGQEMILQRSREGFIAEASLDARAYHCDAVVAQASLILHFPIAVFKDTLTKDIAFHTAWSTHLALEVRRLRTQCERLNLSRTTERIAHYLEAAGSDGSITLNQSRKAWAAELGISHETLYRTLRVMQAEGVLKINRKQITLCRPL